MSKTHLFPNEIPSFLYLSASICLDQLYLSTNKGFKISQKSTLRAKRATSTFKKKLFNTLEYFAIRILVKVLRSIVKICKVLQSIAM